MNILKRLRTYFYGNDTPDVTYRGVPDVEPPDVAEMTRIQLLGHIDRRRFRDMTDGEKMEVKRGCVDLLENTALKYVIDEYIDDVKDHILYEANTEQQVLLGRFSLNGASTVFERIEEYANYEPEKIEHFNKFESI
jgi:hypothetical protein